MFPGLLWAPGKQEERAPALEDCIFWLGWGVGTKLQHLVNIQGQMPLAKSRPEENKTVTDGGGVIRVGVSQSGRAGWAALRAALC